MTATTSRPRFSKKAIQSLDNLLKDVIRNPDDYPRHFVVLPFDPPRLSGIFTEERLRLWGELSRSTPQSITAVAKRLNRNVSRVRQDLLLLQESGLATLQKEGRIVKATTRVLDIVVPSPA